MEPFINIDADICLSYDVNCPDNCQIGPPQSNQTGYFYAKNSEIPNWESSVSSGSIRNFQYCGSEYCATPGDLPNAAECYFTSQTYPDNPVVPGTKPTKNGPLSCYYYHYTDGGGKTQEMFGFDTPTNCEGFKNTYQNVLCCTTYFCNAPNNVPSASPTAGSIAPTLQTPTASSPFVKTPSTTPTQPNTPSTKTPASQNSPKGVSFAVHLAPSMLVAVAAAQLIF